MTATRTLDPSISKTPLALDGDDLATVCVLCSHNCAVRVDVRAGKITAVRGDETSPITTGYICNKAVSIPFYVNHAQRLEHPLRRRADGSFERVGWDTAIAEIGAKLREIRAEHSPRSIGLVGIGGQGNHMDAPYGLGFLRALGSRRWFNAFAQEKTQHNLMDQWMFDASPATFFHADMENARFLLVLGTNPRISQPRPQPDRELQALRRRSQRAAWWWSTRARPRPPAALTATCACGPEPTPICSSAWPRRSCETSSSTTSSCASAHATSRSCARRSRPSTWTRWRDARESTPPRWSRRRPSFARAESAAIFYDLGVEQTPFSTLISYLIRVLLTLTDNVGRRGRQHLHRDPAAAGEGREPHARARARARARLGHSGDRGARQLRHVLADPRARGGARRPPRAPACAHRRGIEPASLVLRHRALARGARTARSPRRDRAGHDGDRACSPTTSCRRRSATRSGKWRTSPRATRRSSSRCGRPSFRRSAKRCRSRKSMRAWPRR